MGLDALAASISEERGTIEDVLEPYLIQQGYLMRTPRGRVATAKTYMHFGLLCQSEAVTPQPKPDGPQQSMDSQISADDVSETDRNAHESTLVSL